MGSVSRIAISGRDRMTRVQGWPSELKLGLRYGDRGLGFRVQGSGFRV